MTPQVSELVRLSELIASGLESAAAADPTFYGPGEEEVVIQFKAAIAAVKAAG
jgi:hypothetical protein